MTNRPHGVLYTGVSSDLNRRVWQLKNGITGGFCKKYNLTSLVHSELCEDMYQAISREKQIKAGSRRAKINLVQRFNPGWRDLYPDLLA